MRSKRWNSFQEIMPIVLFLVGVTILSRLPFLLDPPFISDPSQYTYFAYAIAQGEIPYRDLALPHPPLGYEILSLPARMFGNNLIAMNLFYTVLFSVGIVLCCFVAREVFGPKRKSLATASALVFAFWPGAFIQAFTSPLEVVLTVFILIGFYLYVLYRRSRNWTHMFASGSAFGLSLFVKFTGFFIIIAIVTFELVSFFRVRNLSVWLKKFSPFIIGGLIISIASLLWIGLVWNVFDSFILQVVEFQTIMKESLPLQARLGYLRWFLLAYSPLLVLSITSIILNIDRRGEAFFALPAIVALISMGIEIPLVDTLYHHLLYLTPLFSISASKGVEELWSRLVHWFNRSGNLKPITLVMLFIVCITLIGYVDVASQEPYTILPWSSKNPWTPQLFGVNDITATEKFIGEKVASLTKPNERIFVSYGPIAFFAGRLIETPDVEMWPVQLFGETWLKVPAGVPKYETWFKVGVLEPSHFVSSWQKHNTRVLVFIKGHGRLYWLPYADELLWNGYPGCTGVSDYVIKNYLRVMIVPHSDSGYTYEIWLRKP